jgi:NAD(P)H-hydrate epimerase
MAAYERSGGVLTEVPDGEAWESVREQVHDADLIVDAMLGTGLQSEPSGVIARAIAELAELGVPPRVPIVAVDLPSGLRSDTGDVAWPAVRATCTVTFAGPKYAHVLPPACDLAGELAIADIGIPPAVLARDAQAFLLEGSDVAAAVPPRAAASHKGDYGHVLVIAGSVGKTGAAALAAAGALRAGAGLVTVATPADAHAFLAAGLRAEAMAEPLPLTDGGGLGRDAIEHAVALAEARDVVVIGPGLGASPDTRAFVREVLSQCTRPLIVDADALNAIAPSGKGAGALALLRRSAPTIVTPHPGEMGRLAGISNAEVQRRRLEVARAFALETGATVVLKGHRTLVADSDGRIAVNPTGNPGMAVGGMGDVLAGLLGAFLARTERAWSAATAGVYVHGRAGDLAARRTGETALLPGDLVDSLSEALRS